MTSIKIDVSQAEADVRELKRVASECCEAQRNITAILARLPLDWQGEAAREFIGAGTKNNTRLLKYADDLRRQAKSISAIIKEYERMDAEIARKIKAQETNMTASERVPERESEIHDLKDVLEETGDILGRLFESFK